MAKVGRIYVLQWEEDHPLLPGAEVRIKGLSIRKFIDVQRLAEGFKVLQGGTSAEDTLSGALDVVEQLGEVVGKALVSWNLEDDDDNPINPDKEGILSLEPEAFVELIEAWLDSVAGVSDPLQSTSGDGPPLEELSLTMEPLSGGQSNS